MVKQNLLGKIFNKKLIASGLIASTMALGACAQTGNSFNNTKLTQEIALLSSMYDANAIPIKREMLQKEREDYTPIEKPLVYETFNFILPNKKKLILKVPEYDKDREMDIVGKIIILLEHSQFPNGFNINKTTLEYNNLSVPFNKDIILHNINGIQDIYKITYNPSLTVE